MKVNDYEDDNIYSDEYDPWNDSEYGGSCDISMDYYSSYKHVPLRNTDLLAKLDELKSANYGLSGSLSTLAVGLWLMGMVINNGLQDGLHLVMLICSIILMMLGFSLSVSCAAYKINARKALIGYNISLGNAHVDL